MKSEPKALGAGLESTVDQHAKPETNADGSQNHAFSPVQPIPVDCEQQSQIVPEQQLRRNPHLV